MLNPKYSLPYGRLLLAWTTRSDAKIVRRNCYYLLPSSKVEGERERGGTEVELGSSSSSMT
jgi:hypothetical protein